MQQAFKPLVYTNGWVIALWGFVVNIPTKFIERILKQAKWRKPNKSKPFFFISLLQKGLVQVQNHYNCQEISHAIKTQCEWKVTANPNTLLVLE